MTKSEVTLFRNLLKQGIVFVSDNQVIETFTSFVKPVSKLAKYNERGHMTIVTWGSTDLYVLRKQCHYWNLLFPFTGDELDLSIWSTSDFTVNRISPD